MKRPELIFVVRHVADFSSNCLQLDESVRLKCLQIWLIFIRFDETLALGHDTQFWCNSLFNYCQNHDEEQMDILMEYVWFEDLSTSMHDRSSIEENMRFKISSNPSEYNYEDLVWFENTKTETKNNMEVPMAEVNGTSKDVVNNKATEMDNHVKDIIDMQGKLIDPMTYAFWT